MSLNPIDAGIVAFNNFIGQFVHAGSSALSDLALLLGMF